MIYIMVMIGDGKEIKMNTELMDQWFLVKVDAGWGMNFAIVQGKYAIDGWGR